MDVVVVANNIFYLLYVCSHTKTSLLSTLYFLIPAYCSYNVIYVLDDDDEDDGDDDACVCVCVLCVWRISFKLFELYN